MEFNSDIWSRGLAQFFARSDGPAVDKRVSALAMAIQMGANHLRSRRIRTMLCTAVRQVPRMPSTLLEWLLLIFCGEICLSVTGIHWTVNSSSMSASRKNLLWKVVPGAINIPRTLLRDRLDELPRDSEINIVCRSAQRAYYATRILEQNGFKAKNISGGMLSRAMYSLGELIF